MSSVGAETPMGKGRLQTLEESGADGVFALPQATPHRDGRSDVGIENASLWARIAELEEAHEEDAARILALQTENARLIADNLRLSQEATQDDVTGLPNDRARAAELKRVIAEICRYPHEFFALIFSDVDHFKPINDTLGHQKGDEALRKIAQAIRDVTRANDGVFRHYKGDEFSSIIRANGSERTSIEEARLYAEKIRNAVEAIEITGAPNDEMTTVLRVSLSIGYRLISISDIPQDIILNDAMIDVICKRIMEEADAAMYCAKVEGGNQVVGTEEIARIAAANRLRTRKSE